MRKPGSLAPTEQGLAIAKDSWLLGIGIGLLTRGTVDRQPRQERRAARMLAAAGKKPRDRRRGPGRRRNVGG